MSKKQKQEVFAPPADKELTDTLAQIQIGASIAVQNTDTLKKMVRKSYQTLNEDILNNSVLLNQIDLSVRKYSQQLDSIDHITQDNSQMLKQLIDHIIKSNPIIQQEIRNTPIQNIPYTSLGDLFKGRDQDLKKLVAQIDDPSNTTAITQALKGLGGIGKTRLAVEYAWPPSFIILSCFWLEILTIN